MKKIVCFGDSNTYGFNPENLDRYDENTRWTGILKNNLKETHILIEAGYNNRNCFKDNPDSDELTGYKSLSKYVDKDTDILILLIGTNDLQVFYKQLKK